ncbi:MAG: lipid asymmetry maintenance protein MlaB [Acidobacteriota bacterium]
MSAPLVLDGDLTVFAVAALKDRWMAALNEDVSLTLDGSGVSEVDGAGIQLLLSTCKEAQQRGGSLTLQSPSAQLLEALELIDLRADFCAPTLETSE